LLLACKAIVVLEKYRNCMWRKKKKSLRVLTNTVRDCSEYSEGIK